MAGQPFSGLSELREPGAKQSWSLGGVSRLDPEGWVWMVNKGLPRVTKRVEPHHKVTACETDVVGRAGHWRVSGEGHHPWTLPDNC